MYDLSDRDQDINKLIKAISSLRSERKYLLSSNPTLQNDNDKNLDIAIKNILTYLEEEKTRNDAPIERINAAIECVQNIIKI